MTEDEAAKIMNDLIDKMMAEAIGLPPKPNKLTALRFVGGRFESVEIDNDSHVWAWRQWQFYWTGKYAWFTNGTVHFS